METSRKKSVYLDSTIPSYMFDERKSLRFPREMTRRWWREESGRYDVFTSVETLTELGEGAYPHKEEVLKFASAPRILTFVPPIGGIAERYIRHMVMPKEVAGDAVHLAYASHYAIDFC